MSTLTIDIPHRKPRGNRKPASIAFPDGSPVPEWLVNRIIEEIKRQATELALAAEAEDSRMREELSA